jgi:hypothetical protein
MRMIVRGKEKAILPFTWQPIQNTMLTHIKYRIHLIDSRTLF